MAAYVFNDLKNKYENFSSPIAVIKVNGKEFSKNKANLALSDIEVDLSCGFEASVASFSIYNSFDKISSKFRFEDIKAYIFLGSSVEISLGYGTEAVEVFVGFISKVNFVHNRDIPYVQVTAMDVKGIMMANNYAKQLVADNFGDAVSEIFQKSAYVGLQNKSIIRAIQITPTPDKGKKAANRETDRTIEMVCESDYEFVVKAAKKYNYEFFTDCGYVLFRKAKANKEVLMDIGASNCLRAFDVEYDITGLVETIQARSLDVGKAKLIQAKKKFSNKISKGNKARPFIKKSEMVYIDPTISSQEEAGYRVDSLMEEMSYRFGTLDGECIGMPELKPGRFINLMELGEAVENQFYLVNVRHVINDAEGFKTKICGKAASIEAASKLGI